uniref:UDP-GalNAc:beta-1,3-N-acetylgalactosaminyltransferase 2 n=2 Tax=Helobdella robusta TaxID=6412 RepID=T1ELF6_HELRO
MCSLWYFYAFVPVFIGFYITEYKSDILHLIKYNSFVGVQSESNVLKLFIYIPSSRSNFKEREAIRESWWSHIQRNSSLNDRTVALKFVLGTRDCLIPKDYKVDPWGCDEWKFPNLHDVNNLTKKAIETAEYSLNRSAAAKENDYDDFVEDHVYGIQTVTFIVHHPVLLTKLGVHEACRSVSSSVKLSEATTKKEIVKLSFKSKALTLHTLGLNNTFKFKKLQDPLILPKGFRGEMVVENVESGSGRCEFYRWNFPVQTFPQSHSVIQFVEPSMQPHETYKNVEKWNSRPIHLVNFAFKIFDTDQLIEKIKIKDAKVLETAHNSSLLTSKLHQEFEKNGDMLFVDVVDVYRHLPLKFLSFAQWTINNVKFEFLLKTDDDCYLDVEKILRKLNELNINQSLLFGRFRHNWPVERWGRWAEHSYTSATYPRFPCGSGYVLSSDLVHWMATNYEYLKAYQGEDVSIGIWLSAVNHVVVDEPLWQCENECLSDMYSMPDLQTEQLHKHWENKINCGDPC